MRRMAWQDERSVVNGRSLALLGSLLVAACQGVVQDRDPGSAGRAATSGPSGTSGMSTGTAGSTGGQSGGMPGGPWSPTVGTSWQWQLMGTIDESVSAQMFDVDLFGTTPETVASLQAAGHRVVCYVNAGVFESWRPDAASFPAAVKGKADPGWQGEQWLDIRQWSVLQPILEARMDLCRSKGFDGIELDNVDGYSNQTGFPLTAADQLAFNRTLASSAHARGLSVGLKNDLEQVPDLVGQFDWALNEQCFEFSECDDLRPFLDAGKAVFNVEYNVATSSFCPQARAMGLSSIFKHVALDAYRVACP
jgi:Glycoside-hydrolase family GH114